MERITLRIDGMTCNNCVRHVTNALKGVGGVEVEDVAIGSATVSYDATAVTEQRIAEAVADEGYTVTATTR